MLLKPGVRSRPRTQARSHGAGSRSTARRGLRVTVLAVAGLAACGGRTDLEVEPRRGTPSDAKRCERDADCRGTVDGVPCRILGCVSGACVVVEERACEDRDACTTDRCDETTGLCVFEPRTYDLDGDGYRGPLPGFAPGMPGACGDDCDDSSALAMPGGAERCDGRDNDCNGVVDDGSAWVPDPGGAVRVSSQDALQAMPGGIAHDGDLFGITFHEERANWRNTFTGLTAEGEKLLAPTPVTNVDNDSFSGPLVWTGAVYATAWEDRRDGDFEIYFNRLDPRGRKHGPDVRVAEAMEFSLHPDLLWDGEHFVVVWDDQRDGEVRIYGRLLTFDGAPASLEMPLTDLGLGTESPRLALARRALGMVVKTGSADAQGVAFRTVSPDLQTLGPMVQLADDRAVEPVIASARERFYVAWHTRSGRGPGATIDGAVLDEDGGVLVSPGPITSAAAFARSKTWIALGDRLLLVWAADYGDGYDLYAKLLDRDLAPLGDEVRVTEDAADTASPMAAIGDAGDVGIVFRDRREGPWQVYFSRLRCVPAAG